MKNIKTSAAIVALTISCLAMISCQKEVTTSKTAEDNDRNIELTVSFTDGSIRVSDFTKVAGNLSERETAECKYNNVQVFVFNSDGEIDNCKRYLSGTTAPGAWQMPEPMKCTTGQKEVWVLVNFPVDYTVATDINNKSTLMAQTYRLESINTDGNVNNIIMTGHQTTEFTATQSSSYQLPMSVSRSVCAITLEKVVNLMENVIYRDDVVLKRAYIMQVPGIQKVDGSILASNSSYAYTYWYARHTSEAGAIWTDSLADASVEYGTDKAYTTLHSFYSFPNDLGNFSYGGNVKDAALCDGSDAKSNTYLVVEATINGKLYAYPVVLPKTEANKKYNVTLELAHLGQDPATPWKRVEFTDFQPKITVESWDNKAYTEQI